MIYLDNNATTRTAEEALAAMLPYYTEFYGNSHSAHQLGRKAHEALEHARGEVAALINCSREELIFTSCGSESNALVLRGFQPTTSRRNVVVLAVEHPSVIGSLRALQESGAIDLTVVDVDTSGKVDVDRMAEAITDKTALVAMMLAQNESGIAHPVSQVAAIARSRGAMTFVDAVQAVGKVPVDVKALDVDFLSLSGHKFHAPKGIAGLYVRKGRELSPLWLGGGHENGLRSGTSPVPLAVALGVAARLAASSMGEVGGIAAKRDRFEATLRASLGALIIHGEDLERLPNTSLISFPNAFSDEIVALLDKEGLCASGGAACDSGKREASGVMLAMRQPIEVALGAVRFSLSRYTTDAEIDQAAQIAVRVVNKQVAHAAVTEN